MKLSTLKKKAQQITRSHGHFMRWNFSNGVDQADARCAHCGAWLFLHTHRASMSGRALAIDCKKG